MKIKTCILPILAVSFLLSCKSASIVVLDYDTQSPIENAMVFTEEYCFFETKKRIHTTDKDGIVNIDYHSMNIFAVKEGYSISCGADVPDVIYLLSFNSPNSKSKRHRDFKELETFQSDTPIYKRLLSYKNKYMELKELNK